MANGNITPATTTSGTTNYQSYLDKVNKVAAQTRDIGNVSTTPAEQAASKLKGQYSDVGSALIKNYQQQAATTQKEASKAATGLEMASEYTGKYMTALDTIKSSLQSRYSSAQESWGAAAEKADEYVKASRGRVSEVLTKLDDINSQIAKDRDFSKAHAMQASVQSVLGSMKNEERNILENYGTDSKEYQQFVASKSSTLATVQSNIHSTYQQLAEQQSQTYLNAVSDAYTKSNMYVGFQEQQHVEMLKYKTEAENAYALETAQLETSIEQLKMSGMENLANWVIETPTFSMDSSSLLTAIADLFQTQKETELAHAQLAPQSQGKTTSRIIKRTGTDLGLGNNLLKFRI